MKIYNREMKMKSEDYVPGFSFFAYRGVAVILVSVK